MSNTKYDNLKTYFISTIKNAFAKEIGNNQSKKGKYGVSVLLPIGLDKHDITKSLKNLGYIVKLDDCESKTAITVYKLV